MRHADMMSAYYAAREAWLDAQEAASNGYATEAAEFAAANPAPRLRDFMALQSHGHNVTAEEDLAS